MDKIYITTLDNKYVSSSSKNGQVMTLAQIIEVMKNDKKLESLDKNYKPVLQNQSSGRRLGKNNPDYLKYWDGLIFVDIDNKYNWSLDMNNYYIDMIHQKLCQYPWYVCTTISPSGTGIHIIAYIPAIFHTPLEYYTSSAVVHSRVSEIVSYLTRKDIEQLFKDKVIDTHNFNNYSQIFTYTYGQTLVGESFNPDLYKVLKETIHKDSDYYFYILNENVLNFTMKKELQECLIKDTIIYNTLLLSSLKSLPADITFKGGDSFDFKYNDRIQLVYTLLNYYNKEDTYQLINNIYLTTHGNDYKYRERMREIKSLIESTKDLRTPNLRVLRILKCSYNINLEEDVNICCDTYTEEREVSIDLNNGYLSDQISRIMSNLGDLTVVESPAASGKTTAIANLNENLILTEPYTAIIKNKIENNKKLTAFGCLYGSRRITDEEYSDKTKFCCTPNNVLTLTPEMLLSKGIKYIFVDESHTIIADAEYRLDVMSSFCDKLKEFIKVGIKVVLMTATTLNEFYLMNDTTINLKFISVKKEHPHKKELCIKHYATSKDMSTDLVNDIAAAIRNGYKCIIPTNRGDKYVARITNMLKNRIPELTTSTVTYYTKEHSAEKLNEDITYSANIDNVNVVFAGTSLSVGIDINNTDKCRFFFPDRVTDYNIEQFSARLRKTDKECYLYVVESDKTYEVSDFSYPYANEKYNCANQIVAAYNKDKLFKEPYPLDKQTLDSYPYIQWNADTGNYYVSQTAWNLTLMQYNKEHYNSQLSVIIDNCSKIYGFTVNDYKDIITIDDDSKRIDKNISQMTNREIKMKEYNFVNNICNQNNLTEEIVRNQAVTETDRVHRNIYRKMTDLLDKSIRMDIVQMILPETLDHDKYQFKQRTFNNFISFSKIYWYFKFKIKDSMTLERYVNQIISFVNDRQTVRRETRDKFIDKLQNTIDSNHITVDKNIAKILFDTVVECTEVKKNKFEMKIRRFIHSMFNDKETADNIVKSVLS